MQAHLFLDPRNRNRVAAAITARAGTKKQGQPLNAVIGGARQNEMQDTL